MSCICPQLGSCGCGALGVEAGILLTMLRTSLRGLVMVCGRKGREGEKEESQVHDTHHYYSYC